MEMKEFGPEGRAEVPRARLPLSANATSPLTTFENSFESNYVILFFHYFPPKLEHTELLNIFLLFIFSCLRLKEIIWIASLLRKFII